MAGALSGVVKDIFGVENPSTGGLESSALGAEEEQRRLRAREAQNYAQQQDIAGGLRASIAGTAGPSAAQVQLRQGLDQNNADMMAAGAGSTGVNSVLARYQARQAQGEQAAHMQQAAALLRAQEIARDQALLAQLRAQMGQQTGGMLNATMGQGLSYDQLVAQIQQQNAQRDTILGAAGLQGISQLGGAAFGGKGGQG